MNQARMSEIATGLMEASEWVQDQRKIILIGYAEELSAAAGEMVSPPVIDQGEPEKTDISYT